MGNLYIPTIIMESRAPVKEKKEKKEKKVKKGAKKEVKWVKKPKGSAGSCRICCSCTVATGRKCPSWGPGLCPCYTCTACVVRFDGLPDRYCCRHCYDM